MAIDENTPYDEEREQTRKARPAAGSAAQDRTAGNLEQAKGRIKESAGALTGDERLKAEGETDQMAGTARTKKGQWKERIKAWIDRL